MPGKSSIRRPTIKSINSNVEKHASQVEEAQGHRHMSETVREADYEGHHIVVCTAYQIAVDGTPVTGHMNAGCSHLRQVMAAFMLQHNPNPPD